MILDCGGFLVPMQQLDYFHKMSADPDYELVQVKSEWEIEGKVTAWQFQKRGENVQSKK